METADRTAKNFVKNVGKAEQALEKRLTILWADLQEWQKDNHFITSGYRPTSNSLIGSLASLGYLHNETVNVYSHFLGFVLALAAAFLFYLDLHPRYLTASNGDLRVFACFFGGACICLFSSATYHLLSNHSPRVARLGNSLDYFGIVALIWGSFVPSIYYGFGVSHPELTRTYWTMYGGYKSSIKANLNC